jgi:hypothetical protein
MMRRHSLAPRTVCEVGCGVGEILKQLQKNLPESLLQGFDISPEAIELSRRRANERLQFFCADFLSVNTSEYELLLCMDVVEHVDDYIGFLRGIRQRAIFKMFHIPLELSVQNVFRAKPIAEARVENGHIHFFTRDTALATLAYADYHVVDWIYTASGVYKWYGVINWLMRYPRVLLSRLSPDFVVRVFGGYSLLVLAR